jgi:ribonuclease D
VLRDASHLPPDQLPTGKPRYDGPPPARAWADRDPEAAARLSAARATLSEIADAHDLPAENLLTPDVLRRLLWEPPEPSTEGVVARLADLGARDWQIGLVTQALSTIIGEAVPSLVTGE